MKKRIKYLDELRIFAILMIILLHVLGLFVYKYYPISTWKYAFMSLLSSPTRVGIPIFFMMTGILMFQKKEERNYFEFFKKRVMKLIVAYLFFSFIYYIYHIVRGEISFNILDFIRKATSATTEYHLWFMPVIILIYMFIPFLKKLVDNLKQKELKSLIVLIWIMTNIFVAIEALSGIFGYSLMSSFMLPSLIGYTNYLFVGYYLEQGDYKITKRLIILSCLSILCIPISTVLVSTQEVNDVFLNALSPFVIAPSILILLFFKTKKHSLKEKMSKRIEIHANNVFYVYLIHVLILNMIYNRHAEFIQQPGLRKDMGVILLLWIVVTILSFLFAYLWNKGKSIIKKNSEKITSFVIQFFSILFSILFSGIIITLIINPYHFIKINYLAVLIGILLFIGLFYILWKYQDKIFQYKALNRIMILFYIGIQILIGYCFMVKPSWDFGEVFNIAVDFAKNDHPIFGAPYLYNCDNNIMITVLLELIFKAGYLVGIRNHFVELGILINIVMIDVSIFYFYRFIKKIHKGTCKPFLVFAMFFSPLLFYIPIFYTDTITLPFMIIGLYYIYMYLYEKDKILYLIIAGLLIGIGGTLKPTVLILLIAILINCILNKNKKINYYIFVPVLVGCAILPLLGQKVFINQFFDKEAIKEYRIPTEHYILIGLENNGEFSEKRYQEINQIKGSQNKIDITRKKIKERVKEMIKNQEVIPFYWKKISYTWTDGTFFSHVKLARNPSHPEYTKWVESKNNDILYWTISQSQWIIVLGLIISGTVLRKYLKKEMKELQFILNITIFGIFLFLLIWETRSRYLVNFVSLLLLDAYIGINAITNYRKMKADRRIKK